MAVSIFNKKRKVDADGNEIRKVLQIVNDITIYSPTSGQLESIKKFIEDHIDKENKKVEINGVDVFKVLYKELTDLKDVDTISSELLEDIISHPNEDLEEVNHILTVELNKIVQKMLDEKQELINNMILTTKSIELQHSMEELASEETIKLPDKIEQDLKQIKKMQDSNILKEQ